MVKRPNCQIRTLCSGPWQYGSWIPYTVAMVKQYHVLGRVSDLRAKCETAMRMAIDGRQDHEIASAVGLSLEAVRVLLLAPAARESMQETVKRKGPSSSGRLRCPAKPGRVRRPR